MDDPRENVPDELEQRLDDLSATLTDDEIRTDGEGAGGFALADADDTDADADDTDTDADADADDPAV